MKNRKGTPDIISGLMTGSVANDKKPASNKTINTVNNKPISTADLVAPEDLINNKTIEPASNKAIKQVNLNAGEQESNKSSSNDSKEKVTFNLSNTIIDALDDAWITLRRSKLNDTQRITKTLIVEAAVKLALSEFEERGELSELYRSLKL